MDDFGKSDRPIVPEKSPNNGHWLAEAMEGRGRLKGNPRQAHSHRTLSRVRLSQDLERVRPVATPGVITRGRSPVREIRTPGSVRGDGGNSVPYRD